MARTAKQKIIVREMFARNPKARKRRRAVRAKRVRKSASMTRAQLEAALRKMTGTKKNPARKKIRAKKKPATGRYIIKAKTRSGKVSYYYTGNSFDTDKAKAEVIHGQKKTASRMKRMKNRLPYAIASVMGVSA